jgi:hypothetical protein
MRQWKAVTVVLVSGVAAIAAAELALANPAADRVLWVIAEILAIAGPGVVAWRQRNAAWLLAPSAALLAIVLVGTPWKKPPDPARLRAENAVAQAVAAQIDRVLAYAPPTLPPGPQGLPAARRAFDAALEQARPSIAAEGIRVVGVSADRSQPNSEAVLLDAVSGHTPVCVWFSTKTAHPLYARGGTCRP